MTAQKIYGWEHGDRVCRLIVKHREDWTIEYMDGTRKRVDKSQVTVGRHRAEFINFTIVEAQTRSAKTAE